MGRTLWRLIAACLAVEILTACSAQTPTTESISSPSIPSPTVTPSPTLSMSEIDTQWALTPTIYIPPTSTPRPYIACSGSRHSRLQVGDIAYVNLAPIPNQIRSEPSLETGEIIGQASPGEMLEILDGPGCSDHIVWWQVQVESTGLIGWTGEGDSSSWWLVPRNLFTPEPDAN